MTYETESKPCKKIEKAKTWFPSISSICFGKVNIISISTDGLSIDGNVYWCRNVNKWWNGYCNYHGVKDYVEIHIWGNTSLDMLWKWQHREDNNAWNFAEAFSRFRKETFDSNKTSNFPNSVWALFWCLEYV